MAYSPQQLLKLQNEHRAVSNDLQSLLLSGMTHAQSCGSEKARLYLTQGVGRRVAVLKKASEEIFRLFPPDRGETLPRDDLTAVQIYLHAFVINLSGVFDNWAWAFVHRHGLQERVGGPLNVGMFKTATQDVLSKPLRDFLRSNEISGWHGNYLKTYRDTLAHRIPLYIPPASWTTEDSERYQKLETEKIQLIHAGEWVKLDQVWAEQDHIGKACPMFLHEVVAGGDTRPMLLHPQVVCDGMTVVDFGKRFYAEWHQSN